MGTPKSRTWVWNFDRPVAEIWPVMSDTARFNEAAKLPKHQIEELLQSDGSVRYLANGRFGPVRLEWVEKPVNWVHEQWFEHCRLFRKGRDISMMSMPVVIIKPLNGPRRPTQHSPATCVSHPPVPGRQPALRRNRILRARWARRVHQIRRNG